MRAARAQRGDGVETQAQNRKGWIEIFGESLCLKVITCCRRYYCAVVYSRCHFSSKRFQWTDNNALYLQVTHDVL